MCKIQSRTNSILFKDLEIIHIFKSNLKNSYISISKTAEITLKTPNVSKAFLLDLLDEKETWIRKKLAEVKKHPVIKVNINDEVLLFANIYSMDSLEATSLRVRLEKVKIASVEKTIHHYNAFYKKTSIDYISPRVEYFSKIMDLPYNEIKFRKMKSRWGSCSSKKILTFNTELVKIKKELIDYVIVHELAHLKHMNHSPSFHALVDVYLPNSKNYRKELKNIKMSTF